MNVKDTKDAKDALFTKFNIVCNDDTKTGAIAELYVRAKGKDNIIDAAYKIVTTTESTAKYGSHPRWEYKEPYFIHTEDTVTGVKYIYIRTLGENQVFALTKSKSYNKSGQRVYYGRACGDKMMFMSTPREIIERALDLDMRGFRRFVFDELNTCARSELITCMRSCNYTTKIIPVKYSNYVEIPHDFEITHKDSEKSLMTHKFVTACFSDFLRKLIYGTGEIKGVDKIDLSTFELETVQWFVELLYNPKITFNELDDDQWMLLNYLNIDLDGLITRACVDLCIFQI